MSSKPETLNNAAIRRRPEGGGDGMSAPVDVLAVLDRVINCDDITDGEIIEARAAVAELIEALRLAQRMNKEALPKFNWGNSALDAHAIDLLNGAPMAVDAALARVQGGAA